MNIFDTLETIVFPVVSAKTSTELKINDQLVRSFQNVKQALNNPEDLTNKITAANVNKIWEKLFIKRNFPKGQICGCCGCYYPEIEDMIQVKDHNRITNTLEDIYLCPRCKDIQALSFKCYFCGKTVVNTSEFNFYNFGWTYNKVNKARLKRVGTYAAYGKVSDSPIIHMVPYFKLVGDLDKSDQDLVEALESVGLTWEDVDQFWPRTKVARISNKNVMKNPKFLDFIKKNLLDRSVADLEKYWGKYCCFNCSNELGIFPKSRRPLTWCMYPNSKIMYPSFIPYDDTAYEMVFKLSDEQRPDWVRNLISILTEYLGSMSANSEVESKYTPGSISGRKFFTLPSPWAYVTPCSPMAERNLSYCHKDQGLEADFYKLIQEYYAIINLKTRKINMAAMRRDNMLEISRDRKNMKHQVSFMLPEDISGKDCTQIIQQLVEKHFSHPYYCWWTDSLTFLYADPKVYFDPSWKNHTLEDDLSQGFWSCELSTEVSDLDIERESGYMVIFTLSINLNIQEGNPDNVEMVNRDYRCPTAIRK